MFYLMYTPANISLYRHTFNVSFIFILTLCCPVFIKYSSTVVHFHIFPRHIIISSYLLLFFVVISPYQPTSFFIPSSSATSPPLHLSLSLSLSPSIPLSIYSLTISALIAFVFLYNVSLLSNFDNHSATQPLSHKDMNVFGNWRVLCACLLFHVVSIHNVSSKSSKKSSAVHFRCHQSCNLTTHQLQPPSLHPVPSSPIPLRCPSIKLPIIWNPNNEHN